MIKLSKIISEIKVIGKLKDDNDLLNFLEVNKELVISELEKLEKPIVNYHPEDEEDWKEKFDKIRKSRFEMDDANCPSIGDGINYYSFSLNESNLNTEFDDSIIESLKINNIIIYYISYST